MAPMKAQNGESCAAATSNLALADDSANDRGEERLDGETSDGNGAVSDIFLTMPLDGKGSADDEGAFLYTFRNSLQQARQLLKEGAVSYSAWLTRELPHNGFEYKPQVSAGQIAALDIARKYRFDKLGAPARKRRKLSEEKTLDRNRIAYPVEPTYDSSWLRRCVCLQEAIDTRKCNEFVTRFRTFNDPRDLEGQLRILLKSDASGTVIIS